MNCSRCGAELMSSATFCPKCGTPRQNMAMSSAAPLPSMSPMSTTPPVASYSSPYLPAGTPPWPTTVPQHFPRRTETAPLAPTRDPVERPRRSARNILITAALLVLTVLFGVGLTYGILYFNGQTRASAPQALPALARATPTAQATTAASSTPTAGSTATGNALPRPTTFLAMSSNAQKTLGATVKYPQGWIEDPANSSTSDGSSSVAFHPQQQLGIVMFIARLPASGSSGIGSTSDVNQGRISALSSINGVSNVKPVQPTNPQRTIGGSQWDEQDATFTNSNSSLFKVVSATVKHGQYYYNILYWSPDIYYSEADQKYIQPMLNSFKFA